MSEPTFKITFKGKTIRGVDVARAKSNFSKLFKLPPNKVEVMFDGKERTLKKELPMEKASQLRAVLKKAGIRVSLVKNVVEEKPLGVDDWELNDPGTVILRPVKQPERHIETSHIKVDVDFDKLEDKPQPDPPEVDVDHIAIDDTEEPIVMTKEVEIPDIDLSQLTVDEPGSIIVHHKKIETPDIPTDALSLDEAGKKIVEKKSIPEPEIDISNISLNVK
ncbi:hypothetical protein OS175_11930 [Marinicella sp. S1101]|uniref:hypothetical protein n=1 Tax=Marinicella marina TaxID=2996016 RepID=UPI002260F385|nr:hypothetical protein [Marinicella marina]MCX7554592.1 hypothetical protein [Marinicella marina]MDJ1141024.1 hypothetical protein [Marinicella marina]